MMKHCTFEMRYPPMTKHLSSSSFKACCSILALLMSAASLMDKLVDALFTHVITNDAPGAAVLVAQNGTVLFKKGYGLADVAHGTGFAPDTKSRIGSITKQFTASAILKLQEQGNIGCSPCWAALGSSLLGKESKRKAG